MNGALILWEPAKPAAPGIPSARKVAQTSTPPASSPSNFAPLITTITPAATPQGEANYPVARAATVQAATPNPVASIVSAAVQNPASNEKPVPIIVTGTPSGSAATDRLLPMEVIVNGAKSGTWLFLERAGVLYAPREAFDEWRVELNPAAPTVEFKGQPYSPLTAVPGFRSKINFSTLSVELFFSPDSFSTLRMTKELVKRPVVSPVLTSVFLNYDLNYAASAFRGASSTNDLGLIAEAGLSTSLGILTSSHVGRNLLNNKTLGNPNSWLRLETTFTRDFPDLNRTLRVGDTTTRAGMWGRNSYFGGIQFGSNFSLTPGFIRQPLPVLSGVSAAPSTVELYVNDVLRQVSSVPTGPFALDNFPVMSGGGEARLVVRDILGRETVVTQSFLTNAQLLAKGLNDWSLEGGTLRRELGIASNRYGRGFFSGTWSRGITSEVTLEGRAELTRQLRTAGLGAVLAMPWQLLGKAALAASDEASLGRGGHWLLGFDRQGLRTSASFEVRGASQNFRQLGLETGVKPYKFQVAANWSASFDNGHSFGVGIASISQFDNTRISTLSGNYSMRIGERNNLNMTASRAIAGATGSAMGLTFTMPLGGSRLLNSSVSHHNGGTDAFASYLQNPSPENALGWRLLAGAQGDKARAEAGSYYSGRFGAVTGDVSATRDQKAVRLGTTGGLVFTDGRLFPTRRVDESFAVVEVAGYGGVGIGIGSNVLARTDANGIALVPRLNPYQNNSIRLDPRELPLNAEIESIEQIAVPAWRSAVKVVFPVRTGRGALIKINFDDGQPAPPGAIVKIEGDKQEFYVARRGEAFVTGLKPVNRLILHWENQKCTFDVKLGADAPDEIVRMGPIPCKGVKR